jgi:two-component system response regulator AtoC
MSSIDDTKSRMQRGPADPRPLGTTYLLVVENDSSSVVHLPVNGTIVIGRSSDANVVLQHLSVSRRHATILVDREGLRIADLGSHNGTRVNGERVQGSRRLSSGDVVGIENAVLVVHASNPPVVSRPALDEASWRRRLAEEIERAITYHRPLSVLALGGVSSAAMTEIGASLRLIDVVGEGDDNNVLVLMPESDRELASVTASRIHSVLRASSPGVRGGLASCPSDACDVDSILLMTRKAMRQAAPGTFAETAAAAKVIQLGSHSVLVLDPAMTRQYELLERLGPSSLPVLILGEPGVGKEATAYAVHHYSKRTGPFLAVNCAAFTESLAESTLFGYDKGAFTGATAAKAGLFESAAGGTVFLDEVGDLAPAIQAKLLRVLQEKKIMRVGETREREIDCRIVAATNKSLEVEVAAGRFRQDLQGRLAGATVVLPPLRDRRCEIPLLARRFLDEACRANDRPQKEITPDAMQALLTYHWPSNVRELQSAMAYAAAVAPDERVEPGDLRPEILGAMPTQSTTGTHPVVTLVEPPASFRPLAEEVEELEKRRMREALAAAGGVKTKAAQLIGMPIRTFTLKCKQYGV